MKYCIVHLTGGQSDELPLTESEFKAILRARTGLSAALGIEEKFNLVLGNFEEYERELLDRTLHHLVFVENDWSEIQGDIYEVARRLLNLLSATRLYFDQVHHDLSELYGRNSEPVSEFSRRRFAEYDEHLAFRTMEALRNYVQHRSLPVHELSFGQSVTNDGVLNGVKHTTTPYLAIEQLAEDRTINRRLIGELEKMGESVAITPMVRGYVGAIGRVQDAVRNSIAADVERWDTTMTEAVSRATSFFGTDFALAAARVDDGKVSDVATIFVMPIERRRFLQARAARAAHVAHRYVSGSVDQLIH